MGLSSRDGDAAIGAASRRREARHQLRLRIECMAFRRARVPTGRHLMGVHGDASILRAREVRQFEVPMYSYKKSLISAAMASALSSCLSTQALAQNPPPPENTARAIIAETQAIPPGGINELKAVDLGGIKQWISVRGNDRANPILLFIHGGPGAPMMPESWTFQRPWEDFFTVVQWDQRGAGKTFSAANRQPDASMSIARMQADAEQLIEWLKATYGIKKIFVMGHSWGSVLGLRVAQHHPEWLYAYIGVGQVVNSLRNEAVGYQQTLAQAEAIGNEQAIRELKAIAPYPEADVTKLVPKVYVERKWNAALGGMWYGKSEDIGGQLRGLSPDYTDYD